MGIFNDGWEDEVYRLKAELRTVTAERDTLYDEVDVLRQELQELGDEYDALEAKYQLLLAQQPWYRRDRAGANYEDFDTVEEILKQC